MYWVIRVPIVRSFQPIQRVSWVTWLFWSWKHWWYISLKWSYYGWLFGRPPYPIFKNNSTLRILHIDDIVCGELEVWHSVQGPLKLSFWDIILVEHNAVIQNPEPQTPHAHIFLIYLHSQTCKFYIHPILYYIQPRDHFCYWWRHGGIYWSHTSDLVYI